MQNKNNNTNRYNNALPSTQFSRSQLNAGFTVLEMVVVISLFSIFAGLTMANFGAFKNNTDFAVSVQEVALLIKEQQQTAMAGKLPQIDPTVKDYPAADWKPAYGVYFSSAYPNKMLLYYDKDSYYQFTSATSPFTTAFDCDANDNECVKEITFNDMTLDRICIGGYVYPNCNGPTVSSNFSIVFKRPFPDAYMRYDVSTSQPLGISASSVIDLVFKTNSISNSCNIIQINPIGAISVRKESCT